MDCLGTKLAPAGSTSHINSGDNEVEGKVGGWRDILCGTAKATAGPTSHTNEDNDMVEGKVMGGGMACPGRRLRWHALCHTSMATR
jgi:hypothetical protein